MQGKRQVFTIDKLRFEPLCGKNCVVLFIDREDESSNLIEDELALKAYRHSSNVSGVMSLRDFKYAILDGIRVLASLHDIKKDKLWDEEEYKMEGEARHTPKDGEDSCEIFRMILKETQAVQAESLPSALPHDD